MPFIIFKYNKCYCTALGTNAPTVKTEYSMTGCFFLFLFFNSEQIVVNNEKGMEAMKNHFYLFFI